MKENGKIARQLKNFYIGVTVVALLLVIFNVLYAGYDSGLAFTGEGMEQKIERMVTEQAANHTFQLNTDGFDLIAQVQTEGAYEIGNTNLFFMLLLLFVAWGIYYMQYQRGQTKEFLLTTPVKGRKWILQPFFVMGGIVIAAYVFEGIGLLLVQTRYNQLYQRIVERKGIGTIDPSCIERVNADLCGMLLVQLLIVLILYVWFSFWMVASKHKVVGALAACGFIYWYYWVIDFFYYRGDPFFDMVEETSYDISVFKVARFLYYIINPFALSERMSDAFSQQTELGYSVGTCMAIKVAEIVIGIFAIVWIARRREYSKGRFFYTTGMDVFVSILAGIAALGLVFVGDYQTIHIEGKTIVKGCIVAVVIAAVVFYVLHLGFAAIPKEKEQKCIRITHKRAYQEASCLFRLEWKENLFFLVANCIWWIVQCKGYSLFWGITQSIDVVHSYSINQIEDAVSRVYDSLDSGAGEIISWYIGGVVVAQIIWLLGRKLIQSYKERTVSGREFMAKLPVSRQARYRYETIRDCVMLILPVIISTFMIQSQFFGVLQGAAINIYWGSQAIWGLTIISCSYLLMVYGLIRWLEVLIPNGVLRMPVAASFLCVIHMVNEVLVRCGAVGRTINNLLTLHAPLGCSINAKGEYIYDLKKPEIFFDSAMEYINSTDYNVTAPAQVSAFYNVSNVSGYIGYVLLYIAIAAVFLYFAGRLAKKQEHSVEGLYFPFAKYVFAAAVSIAIGIVLMQNAVAWWHRMMIGILIIGIFAVFVYYLDPERKLIKRQKVGVVK